MKSMMQFKRLGSRVVTFRTIDSFKTRVERAWRSGSVMDCHATTRGSIPVGNGVFTELYVLRKGQ